MIEIRLPLRAVIPFASGSIGMGIWVTVPGILLLYFLTDVLAVPPATAGLALLIPNIADIVLHPWIGRVSDTDRAATGHRRRVMLAGCAVIITFIALFTVPAGLRGTSAAIWVALALVAGNLLYSAYQVPYLATPADLGIGYHERTRLMGFRNTVITIGVLLSGVIAPLLTGTAPDVGDYTRMAAILGAVMLAAMLTGILGVARVNRAAPPAPAPAAPHRGGLLAALRDRHFRVLSASYLTMAITMNLVLAALPYFAKYELGRPELTPALVALFMGPAVLTTPLWVLAARRLGKQRCLLAAQAGFVAGSLVLAAGAAAGLPVLVGAMTLLGVSFAAMQLMPLAMMPDVIAASGPGGTTRAGAYTGLWTAAEATGGALGPYVFSAVLFAGGFVASAAGEQVTQTPGALDAVRYGFTLVPAALMTVAVLLQRRYTLDHTRPTPDVTPVST
ncbi:sugar transporter [Actinoplanes italicus]|uniref:Na+/melibiose symporter-like transporter n=1 Tax=Actinoplanes italicus TaxID=113567 RepID=A0A2T0KHF0_9ACTN|nr:MFS transporter [Actinoplanes italicus]PRX22869.1 Na+/melibiose symporter-like transporter [Actinoplanes italicus]GIE28391.1 sugar transporter [Actinoplanes italicus]